VSPFDGMSLSDYISVMKYLCSVSHQDNPCLKCSKDIAIRNHVLSQQPVPLSELWKAHYPLSSYKSYCAVRKFGKMQLVFITLLQSNIQVVYVIEKEGGVDDSWLMNISERLGLLSSKAGSSGISRATLKLLKELATSEKDRKLIQYASAAHLSGVQARKMYGIGNHRLNCKEVEDAISSAHAIQKVYQELARTSDMALLVSYDIVSLENDMEDDTISEALTDDIDRLTGLDLEGKDELVIDSTDSSDNDYEPDEWYSIKSPAEPAFRDKVSKHRKYLKDKAHRLATRKIAEERILRRQISRATSNILSRHPDIGHLIEGIVRDAGVGADKWRSTGSLTWERKKVGQKMTIERLRKEVSNKIGEPISHGTMVELCVPRNVRSRSSSRYKSAANIISKRARKSFDIKINIDEKWSNSLYKSLDAMQLHDHGNVFYMNRDDAAGFRLDTLATYSKFPSLMVKEAVDLATRTDLTNKDQFLLQVTSHSFTAAKNSDHKIAGVVRSVKVDKKNAAQHLADLEMLREDTDFKSVFFRKDGEEKEIDFIRVDGGGDESPSHIETQFHWAEWHLKHKKLATLVTTRYSGGSFLNEQLSRAATNLFIPSTINGPNKDPTTGQMDDDRLRSNMEAAKQIYIDRVNNTSFKGCQIKLVLCNTSVVANELQDRREYILKYLKATPRQKISIREKASQHDSASLEYYDQAIQVMEKHRLEPTIKYVFGLLCCFQPDCPHPNCQNHQGQRADEVYWYEGGPPLQFFPWPVRDENSKPEDCTQCSGPCSGHFMRYPNLLERYTAVNRLPDPGLTMPSDVINNSFVSRSKDHGGIEQAMPDDELIQQHSTELCLSRDLVQFQFNHLREVAISRQRGARKAAETRAANRE
jgi:hypothetical protein